MTTRYAIICRSCEAWEALSEAGLAVASDQVTAFMKAHQHDEMNVVIDLLTAANEANAS